MSAFSTQLLLPITAVSHRFHDLVLGIVHRRLLVAAAFKDRKLLLECYHPSSRNTEPYLFCDYLGTPGLSSEKDGEGSAYHASQPIGRLGKLSRLYSRFRPVRHEAEQRLFRPHPAGDVPGNPGTSTYFPARPPSREETVEPFVSHTVNLESHELFSQLMVVTNLVQLGPRRGVFYSFVNIADGVVRVWRAWLAERASSLFYPAVDEDETEQTRTMDEKHTDMESRMLWVGNSKNVGIRVRVCEKTWRRNEPILLLHDEDPAVSYGIEYEGESSL